VIPDAAGPSAIIERIVRGLPKVSLHCHLLGSVRPATVVELARKHGVDLGARTAETLYDHSSYEDLAEFLRVLDVVGSVVRDRDDLHRVTYESLTIGGAAHNVLHREIQISPPGHGEVPYPQLIEGIIAGMRDARTDTGITSTIVVGLCREDTPAAARQLVETVIEHRRPEVVGIGLDYAEVKGAPARFAPAFIRAGEAGLRRTAHSETGPPHHIEVLLDELGCDRVDHGYHVVDDPGITARCVEEDVAFICTPVSSDIGRYSGSGDGSHRRIAQMVEAGLKVAIDSDDPPMFGTDPTHDFRALAHALDYGLEQLAVFTRNAVDACWLDTAEKAELRARVEEDITALMIDTTSAAAEIPDVEHP
jgi:adenosine deaminase